MIALTFDESGRLWAGSHTGEVFRYDGQLWVEIADRQDLSAGPIHGLVVDEQRNTWALSRNDGVFRYDGSDWTPFGLSKFDSLAVRQLVVDGTGAPIALTTRALWRYAPETKSWTTLPVPELPAAGDYRRLYFDPAGWMYLATTKGLAVIQDGLATWLEARNGLRGREVTSLLVDESYLWVGFRRDGISRISLENLR